MSRSKRLVVLRCSTCKRQKRAADKALVDIPPRVAVIESRCPKCDDGDFDFETWLDAKGREVSQFKAVPR